MLLQSVSRCYVITREWLFCVHFINAEDFSISSKSNLMHIAPSSEDDMRQLSYWDQRFLFSKETKWLSVPENPDNLPQLPSQCISTPFPRMQCFVSVFFRSCAPAQFSSQGAVNSLRRTVFFESDHATMSSRFSFWIMWAMNSSEVFWNWIMGSWDVTVCWFAVSRCALNNSMTTFNNLFCRHIHLNIWSDCGLHGAKYLDHFYMKITDPIFWLVAFSRLYVERKRNDIVSSSIAIKDFYDYLIDSVSFNFVQTHCNSCSSLLLKHPDFFAHHTYIYIYIF